MDLVWKRAAAASGETLDWRPPKLDKARMQREVRRAARGLKAEGVTLSAEQLTDALESGKLKELDLATWDALVNDESKDVKKFTDVFTLAKRRNKKVRDKLGEFIDDKVKAPIIVCFADDPDKYYLVNGETRLSICRALGIVPQVWSADLPKELRKGFVPEGKAAAAATPFRGGEAAPEAADWEADRYEPAAVFPTSAR